MSKLSRESIEKAEKLLAKRQEDIEGGIKKELEERLVQAADLANQLLTLKEAAREKRLDIEENARALTRLTNKAKREVETAQAARKTGAKAAKRELPPEPKNAAQKKAGPSKRAAEGASPEGHGDLQ